MRPGQKFPGLSFEGTVHRHWSAQGRTVKLHFYLGAIRRVLDSVRRNDHEMAVFFALSYHCTAVGLAQLVQSMLAGVRQP